MYCNKCGSEIKEDDRFCTNCGNAVKEENQTTEIKQKKNNAGLIVGIIILAVIAVLAVITTLDSKKENAGQTPAEPANENTQTVPEQTPKTVEFNGYTFTIPVNVTPSTSDDKLFIYGPQSKWVGVVMMQEGKYDTLVSMKDQIKTALSAQEGAEQYDMTAAVTEEKEYGGKPFLITRDIKSGNYSLDISYGKADDNNVYVISITKSDGTALTEAERAEMYTIVASGQK